MIQKVIIVEDEALIADHLGLLLSELGYNVIGIVDNANDLFEIIDHQTPDLVLLDIHITGNLDGVDIGHVLPNKYHVPFIYITSNADQKTLDRVKMTNHSGFITKPFNATQLASTISLIHSPSANTDYESSDAFFIKEKHALLKLNFEEVLYVEAADNYSILHTVQGKHVLSQTLKLVSEKLELHGFARSHRSFLVNISKIEKIEPKAVIINQKEIPLSENCRNNLLNRLNLF